MYPSFVGAKCLKCIRLQLIEVSLTFNNSEEGGDLHRLWNKLPMTCHETASLSQIIIDVTRKVCIWIM